ncbi:hypothetical protein BG011_004640 [Mortierella polycephala]|uniref:Uncharacterized protein n=1 Tax=Mortierella polycephala TaxID=41804 RepID=A0A9P6PY28_9FUNG|nr:hypothetical protein BG011_004640 [Mortierella polycephala]
MADQPTTTAQTTPRPRATNTTSGTTTRTVGPTSQSSRTTRSTRSRTTIIATGAVTTTATPSPTIAPGSADGSSGALIGGIAAGVVMVFGLIGLLFYKKRKRAAVAAETSAKGKAGAVPEKYGPSRDISGPMALAPEGGIDAVPEHRPEAHFREQQQFKPGMRDELFAQPGSALHTNLSDKKNRDNGPGPARPADAGRVDQISINKEMQRDIKPPVQTSPSDGYYDDHLVHDYYNGDRAATPDTIGAQRPAPQYRDHNQGNLTPSPDYYLGKEDIDPRRDLKGFDTPENYAKVGPSQGGAREMPDSPRSSFSSGRNSTYMTPEQAQQAHNNKMRGHKESISSINKLVENALAEQAKNRSNRPIDHSFSVAMSESTVSMMPALPPTVSPLALNGANHQQQHQQQQHHHQQQGIRPGPGQGPLSSMSSIARDDPYAESAISEDYLDDRSLVSAGYYHQNHQQHQQQYQGSNNGPSRQHGGPYSPQPMSPTYHPQNAPYSPSHGYNNNSNNGGYNNRQYSGSPPHQGSRPQQPFRGGEGGYGPGPGYGSPNYGPQQGHRPGPPREPEYNQGPYQRQY